MIQVPIREEIFEPIQKIAEEADTNAERLIEDWLTRQLALAREKKIREEAVRFRAAHPQLLVAYEGEYVAMQNGEVLDHDLDVRELYLRIKKRYGDAPILIAAVTPEPTQIYQMRSPRLVR